jgi:DNA replication protein DnaC
MTVSWEFSLFPYDVNLAIFMISKWLVTRNRYTAYYITCADLIENLTRAKENNRLKRKLIWFKKPHLLLIDEVGYESLTQEQANLFFQVVNHRYEQGSIIMTTNKSFGKWAEVLSDEAIASATLDRLLHHANIFSLVGDSYRMKDRLKAGVVDFF